MPYDGELFTRGLFLALAAALTLALAAASGERQSLYASFKRGCDDVILLMHYIILTDSQSLRERESQSLMSKTYDDDGDDDETRTEPDDEALSEEDEVRLFFFRPCGFCVVLIDAIRLLVGRLAFFSFCWVVA